MINIDSTKELEVLTSFMNDNREAKGVLMATLLKAQELYGYISEDVIRSIDKVLGVPASRIDNIVNFYSFFNTKPVDYIKKIKEYESKQTKIYTLKDISDNREKIIGNLDKYDKLDSYIKAGGFNSLKIALSLDSNELNKQIKDSGYKGRGDGGFVIGSKMDMVASVEENNKGVICNADMISRSLDSKIIRDNPYKLIESIILVGYGVGSNYGYIYTQDTKEMKIAVEDAYKAGILGKSLLGSNFSFDIEVRYSNDTFISPREVETDKYVERDLNIHRENKVNNRSFGVYGRPREYHISDKCIGCTKCAKNCPVSCITSVPKNLHVINQSMCISCGMCMSICPVSAIIYTNFVANVETLINLPDIVLKGADAFKEIGDPKNPGVKIISIEGDVNKPSLIEVETDIVLKDIIRKYAGGSLGEIIGIRIGGPIGTILNIEALEKPVDFEAPLKYGLITGVMEAISLYVIAGKTSLLDIAKNSVAYSVKESCGKCTPCREGTKRLEEALNSLDINREDALAKIETLAEVMKLTSLCSLGQLASTTVGSILAGFKDKL